MPIASENLIAWGDCDAAGIVYYPRFFNFMDIAFQALLRKAGLDHHRLFEKFGARVPIVDANAKFLSPATFEDRILVYAEIAHWGTKSFRVNYQGSCEGVPVFEGHEVRYGRQSRRMGLSRRRRSRRRSRPRFWPPTASANECLIGDWRLPNQMIFEFKPEEHVQMICTNLLVATNIGLDAVQYSTTMAATNGNARKLQEDRNAKDFCRTLRRYWRRYSPRRPTRNRRSRSV